MHPLRFSEKGFLLSENGKDILVVSRDEAMRRFSDDGWSAQSILVVGGGEFYVVLWRHHGGAGRLWFLKAGYEFLTDKPLLSGFEYRKSRLAQLWSGYLTEVVRNVWGGFSDPVVAADGNDGSRHSTLFAEYAIEDVREVVRLSCEPWRLIDIDSISSSVEGDIYPVKLNYLADGFASFADTPASNWQDRVAASGCVQIKSPYSGDLLTSTQSILVHSDGFVTAYRFVADDQVFYLLTGTHHNALMGYYFPRQNSFLFKSPLRMQKHWMDGFVVEVVRHWMLIQSYLQNGNLRKIAGSSREPHLGHHLWNELSGIDRLARHSLLENIAEYFVPSQFAEHYGEVDQLFDQLSGKVRRINVADLPRNIYAGNYLHLRPSDRCISEQLARRIISLAMAQSSKVPRREDGGLKIDECAVVILFTLRLDNRSWVDQESGIVDIVSRLCRDIAGGVTLIIDGHNVSLTGDRLKSHGEDAANAQKGVNLFDLEYSMAIRIKEALASKNVLVVNTIGCTVPESIYWSMRADFFVAPWGAGLSKCKWVANKPGLVFSSRRVLLEKPDLHIYDRPRFRENAYPCEYLDPEAITDLNETIASNSNPVFRDNFSLSIDRLYERVLDMTKRYGRVNRTTMSGG